MHARLEELAPCEVVEGRAGANYSFVSPPAPETSLLETGCSYHHKQPVRFRVHVPAGVRERLYTAKTGEMDS